MGYNHPKFLSATDDDLMQRMLATRTGVGIFPIKEQERLNQEAFMDVAPKGMERVTAANCGTCANEGAYKIAMMAYAIRKNGGVYEEPTPEELCTCLLNQAPGSPNYAILSLKQGFHGRMLGALSTSRTNPLHKLDFPAFDWPAA
jgi:4-aminobutyrate aminotransferase / (S)-3-amino-2-methylpropionate transaminase